MRKNRRIALAAVSAQHVALRRAPLSSLIVVLLEVEVACGEEREVM
jgi:hypothetical protein